MKVRFPAALALAAVALLGGCSSQYNTLDKFREAKEALFGDFESSNGEVRARITPEIIAGVGRPVLYAYAPERKVELVFVEDFRNGDYVTWIAPSNESITLRRGVLVSTRGVAGDLMTADVDEVLAALAGRSDRAVRVHRYLDGENHIVARSFVCDYARRPEATAAYFRTIQATRVDETCHGPDQTFENRYWVGGSGEIVRAEQWVSDPLGHLDYERLSNWATSR